MDCIKFIVAIWIGIYICEANEIVISNVTPNKGDTVTLTCTGSPLVKAFRKSTDMLSTGSVAIAPDELQRGDKSVASAVVKNALKTGRYSAKVENNGGKAIMTIKNVQPEDSGYYFCEIFYENIPQRPNSKRLNVKASPSIVNMQTHGDERILTVKIDDKIPIACEAEGSTDASTLSVMRGDVEITSLLKASSQYEISKDLEKGDPFFKPVWTATADGEITAKLDDHGRRIECIGSVPGQEAKRSYFAIDIEGATTEQKLNCTQDKTEVSLAEQVTFVCIVPSMPPVTDLRWFISSDSEKINLTSGQNYKDEFVATQKDLKKGQLEATLTARFSYKYMLNFDKFFIRVENNLGAPNYTFPLTTIGKVSGGASTIPISYLVISLAIAMFGYIIQH